MKTSLENSLMGQVYRKLSSWKRRNPSSETLCVASQGEIDFFRTNLSVFELIDTVQEKQGLSRIDALKYLRDAQFSDAAIH